jgi:hypothetical protein
MQWSTCAMYISNNVSIWKCKVVSIGQKMETACGVVYYAIRNTVWKGTNVLSARWNCVDPYFMVCCTKLPFWDQHHTERGTFHSYRFNCLLFFPRNKHRCLNGLAIGDSLSTNHNRCWYRIGSPKISGSEVCSCVNIISTERIVLLDFIHRLVSQKIEKLKIYIPKITIHTSKIHTRVNY